MRQEQKRKSMEYNVRNRNKSRVLRASYLDPDAAGDLDLEEDISAIKSSIRSRIGGKRGAVESSNLSSEEEEEIEERLARAKDMTEESSPPAKKMARRSRGGVFQRERERESGRGREGGRERELRLELYMFATDIRTHVRLVG